MQAFVCLYAYLVVEMETERKNTIMSNRFVITHDERKGDWKRGWKKE